MTLHRPCIITARLLPGVRIGEGLISVKPLLYRDEAGRQIWRYYIDLPSGSYACDDLKTHGGAQGALETLLVFLGAAAESYPDGENADLFPDAITEWAHQHSDEISLLACELEETKNLIEE